MIIRLIIIFILLVFSAFFSASETALTTVSRIKLKAAAEQGSQKAKNALAVLEKYDKALSTFLIGNNVVNIAIASIATAMVMTMTILPPGIIERYGIVASTIVVTFFTLTFGDILPKTIARICADSYCLHFGGFLRIFVAVMTPVSAVFLLIQKGIGRAFSKDTKAVTVTEQELIHFIEEAKSEGVLEEQESNLVKSALIFDETTAGQILTPRVKITAVSVNEDIKKVRDLFLSEGYSRIPVYEKTLDHICGTLYNKDFMKRFISSGDENFSIREIMKDALYVTSLMKISEVLKLMQKEKLHLAVVVDQYGGTEGLVTLEDILEELVGEIWDEGDEVSSYIKSENNIFEVSGELSVNDFNRYFKKRDIDFEIITDSGINTVGGWVFELFGKIPEEKEVIETDEFKITVLSLQNRRIQKLKFELPRNK